MKKTKRKRPVRVDYELLAKIERAMGEKNLSASAFGTLAVNDPGLIKGLHKGRNLSWYVRERVEKFIAGQAA